MLKVLHINCNYVGTTLHQLMIETMDQKGIENEVFVPIYDKNMAVIKPNENVTVSECFSKWDRLVFDYKQRKIIRAIEENYNIADFDLIHAYTLFTDGNVARNLSKKYGIPYVVAIRNTDVNDFFRKRIFLRSRGVHILLSSSKNFFLSSSYQKNVFEGYIPQKYQKTIEKKSEIIPNGIDGFWFQNVYTKRNYIDISQRIEQKIIKLIYVGNIDKNKNILLTCKAIELLKKEKWKIEFIVVGKIRDRSVYREIKDHIKYMSPQPKERLVNIYRNADLFVMPSIFETFGLVYAEAMSQGLPVIYSKGQGFDEQFEEGVVGFHVSSGSEKELAEKIKLVTQDYENISKRALSCIKKFNWDQICNKYVEIYKKVID